ncbi:hypothetical protein BH24ACT11_BH24ACT11_12230 [soil metagenome]
MLTSAPAAARLPHPPGDHGPAQLEHTDYDVVVVGGGPPGEVVASRAAAGGLSVIVVEAELVGGECSYWACMPSKALLRPVEARSDARAIGGSRQSVTGDLDAGAVLARRDEFTHGWDDSSQVDWLDSEQLALVRGRGRITGDRQVEVVDSSGDRVTVTATHAVVLCVGSIGAAQPIDGIDGVAPGARATPPAPTSRPAGCWSSAAAWSGSRWPPHGRRSAHR